VEIAMWPLRYHGSAQRLAMVRYVTDRKRAERAIRTAFQELAMTDALTQRYNRRAFEFELRREIGLGERFGTPVSLIAIDIDHFKLLNDRDGHPTGDRFLTVLTDRHAGLEPGGTRSAMDGVRGPAAVLTPSIAGDDRPAPPAASSEAEVDVPADLAADAEEAEPAPPEALEVPMAAAGPFQVGEVNGVPVVAVAGDVDLSNAHMLQAALEQAARTDRPTIVVSLGGSAYFDSQGIHMLLRFNRRLETSRGQLVVVVPWHHPLKAVLDALGNSVNLKIVQTVVEALAKTD
jgi:anti-anti-sigma factor